MQELGFCAQAARAKLGFLCFSLDLSMLSPDLLVAWRQNWPSEACPSSSMQLNFIFMAQRLVPDAASVTVSGPMTILAPGLACQG